MLLFKFLVIIQVLIFFYFFDTPKLEMKSLIWSNVMIFLIYYIGICFIFYDYKICALFSIPALSGISSLILYKKFEKTKSNIVDVISTKKEWYFLCVQALLLIIIFFSSIRYSDIFISCLSNKIVGYFTIESFNGIASWLLSLLLVLKPADLIIKNSISKFAPKLDESEKGYPNVGSLIGRLERVIILMFLSVSQYSAIGFILTAKSIARYERITKDSKFSEYYLLGTLSSVLIAIIIQKISFL